MSDEARAIAGKAGPIADVNNRHDVEAVLDSAGLNEFIVELGIARVDHEIAARLALAWGVDLFEARARLTAWAEALEAGPTGEPPTSE